jgi:GNAT superfamily N-acetyltransferase
VAGGRRRGSRLTGVSDIRIRAASAADRMALSAVCLATAADGGDAAPLHRDGTLPGLIYAEPYLACPSAVVLAVEDEAGVGGYACGVTDTRVFEAWAERAWWPPLRARHPDPGGTPDTWDADAKRRHAIHHPLRSPDAVVRAYPAHLHMNLLARLQGRGVGTRLLTAWLEAARLRGAAAVHVATGRSNPRALAFWRAQGFETVLEQAAPGGRTRVWLGRGPASGLRGAETGRG